MRSFLAIVKKECTEAIRSGRLLILTALFFVFGVMNPAIAKLTPWLLEIMADSLAESGMTVTAVTVSAIDSWVQFFKNIPMALIAFVLLEAATFTKEYASGTLLLSLTKGLSRFKVVLSKSVMLIGTWSVGYLLCLATTYFYNAYFWDNAVAKNLALSLLCPWIFGVFAISLIVFLSTVCGTGTGVLLGTGGVIFASYLLGIIPKVNKYLPTLLMDGNSLIYGTKEPQEYLASILITVFISISLFAASVPLFNKKQL